MIDINKLLEDRCKYGFTGREDYQLDEVLNTNPSEFSIITTISMFNRPHQLRMYEDILENYNIEYIIKTKSPFLNINVSFCIFGFTKKDVKKIVLSSYNERPWDYRDNYRRFDSRGFSESGLVVANLNDSFNDYIKRFNDVLKSLKSTDDIYVIDYKEFSKAVLNPDCYSPSSLAIKNEILNNKKDFVKLSDIAVISPDHKRMDVDEILVIDQDGNINTIQPRHNNIVVCETKEGDILIKRVSKTEKFEAAVITNEYAGKYANFGLYSIVRLNDVKLIPYIYYYISDPKALYYFMSTTSGCAMNLLSPSVLNELMVYKPTEDMIKNATDIYNLQINKEQLDIEELNKAIRNINNSRSNSETKRALDISFARTMSMLKTKMAYEVINDDLKELDICYQNSAYKASVILCGSILETILLDWLSEYEESDTITDIAMIEDSDKDMDLKGIIYKLSKLIKPEWYEKKYADEIRRTRNYVHPKLYIRNNVSLNDEECKKIIDDLKEIIDSRINRD